MSASNIPGVRDVGSEMLKYSKPTREQDTEVFQQIPEDSISSYVAPAALGIGKLAPLMLSGLGPLGMAASYGLSGIGEKEAQMEDQGVSRQAAAPAAMTSGIANTILGTPLFATARSGLNPIVKSGLGAIEGYGQGALGTLADIYGTYQSTGDAPEFDQAISQMNKSGIIGAGTNAVLAPLGGNPKKGNSSDVFDLPTENVPPGTREQLALPDPQIPERLALPGPSSEVKGLPLPEGTWGDGFVAKDPTVEQIATSEAISNPILKNKQLPAPEGIFGQDFVAKDLTPEQQALSTIADTQIAKDRIESERQSYPVPVPKVKAEVDVLSTAESFPNVLKSVKEAATSKDEALNMARSYGKMLKIRNEPFLQELADKLGPNQKIEPSEVSTLEGIQAQKEQIQAQKGSRFMSERGSITTEPFRAVAEKVGSITEGIKAFVRGSDPTVEAVSPTQARYEGGRLRFISRDMGRALGAYRENFEYLSTAAQSDPRAKVALDAGREFYQKKNQILFDARESADPYFSASKAEKANLDKDLIRFRQASLDAAKQGIRLQKLTPEFLASKGWSPKKIEMWQSVRTTMDNALEIQRQAFYREADNLPLDQQQEFIAEVDKFIEAQKDMNYIPMTRFGKNVYLEAKDANGKVAHRSHYESVAEAKVELAKLKAQGLKGKIKEIPTNHYDAKSGIAPDLLPDASSFNAEKWQQMKKEGKPMNGYAQHLIKAAGIEGFNQDLTRNISDYLFSLANFAANKDLQPKVKEILRSIDVKTDPALSARIAKHFDAMTSPRGTGIGDKMVGGAVRISNLLHLAGTPITAVADILQAQAMAIPMAIKEMKGQYNPLKHVDAFYLHEKSFAKTMDYLANPLKKKGVTSLDKTTLAHLKIAERDGLLGTQTVNDLYDYAQGPGASKPLDHKLMLFKTAGEKIQSTSSFITGLEVAKRLKLEGDAAYNFAKDFFYKTVPDTTKADNPLIMNNSAVKLGTLYKKYLGFELRTMRNFFNKEDFPLILSSLAMKAGLGGVLGVAGAKEVDKIAKSFGIDIKEYIKSLSPEWADEILYGLPSSKINLSPSLSTQELFPDIAKNPKGAIMSTLGGPLVGYIADRVPKAYSLAKEGKYVHAFEAAAPRFARNISKASRLLIDGNLKDSSGFDPEVPPTYGNAARLLLGSPPIEQTKAYDMKNAMYDEMERGRQLTSKFNRQFTEAIDNQDLAQADKIAMEAAERGISVKYRASEDPVNAMIKRAPKVSKQKMREIAGIESR